MAAAIGIVLVATFVYLPWLVVALWLTTRFRGSRGEEGVVASLLILAVFCALAFVLPVIAGVMLFFWAFTVGSAPIVAAIAYIIAVAPAFWITRRLKPPLEGRRRTAAMTLALLGLVFWLPPIVIEVPATIIALALGE